MGKKDIIKSAFSILIIIVLAVFIVNINKIITPRTPKIAEERTSPRLNEPELNTVVIEGSVTDYGKCFADYGGSSSTVVFVYSNSCPYCNRMKPIIEELEGEGYKFYWAESSNSEAREIVDNCFSDLLSGYVPQFICPATGKEQTGGMGKAELKGFADSCI